MSPEEKSMMAYIAMANDPAQAELHIWRDVASTICNSEFWKSRMPGLSGQTALAEFGLSEFADYRKAIDVLGFEAKISPLNNQPIIWWARSSGTTESGSKFIPYTAAFAEDVRTKSLLTTQILLGRIPGLQKLQQMGFPAMNPVFREETGLPVAPISSFMRHMTRPDLTGASIFPQALLKDGEFFWRWAPYYALASRFEVCSAVSAAFVETMYNRILASADVILDFFRDNQRLPDPLPGIAMTADRQSYLRTLLSPSKRPTLKEIWPDLRILSVWKSGTSRASLEKFRSQVGGGVDICHLQYNSSESLIALPSINHLDGGPIFLPGTIVEFLPWGQQAHPHSLIKMWDLQVGQQYEIFVTNRLGFVRYRLHDVVTCLGYFHRTPIIQFNFKARACITFGIANISEAVLLESVLQSRVDLPEKWFFAPSTDSKCLELIVAEPVKNSESVCQALETKLKELCQQYREVRTLGAIDQMKIRLLPPTQKVWERFQSHNQAKRIAVISQPVDSL